MYVMLTTTKRMSWPWGGQDTGTIVFREKNAFATGTDNFRQD